MATGNIKNLIPQSERTKAEQRKIATMGGKASGESRKKRKTLREELLLLLQNDNNQENMTISLIKKALDGDIKAFEVIRDTIGEKPKEVIENFNHNEEAEKYSKLTEEELKKLAGE